MSRDNGGGGSYGGDAFTDGGFSDDTSGQDQNQDEGADDGADDDEDERDGHGRSLKVIERYDWVVSEWSACSRKCGGGERTRQVRCARFANGFEDSDEATFSGAASSDDDAITSPNNGKCDPDPFDPDYSATDLSDKPASLAACGLTPCDEEDRAYEYLQVSLVLAGIFYNDVAFSGAATDAFHGSILLELSYALNLDSARVVTINTRRHALGKVSVECQITSGAQKYDQSVSYVRQHLLKQCNTPTSALRTTGTYLRYVDPTSVFVDVVAPREADDKSMSQVGFNTTPQPPPPPPHQLASPPRNHPTRTELGTDDLPEHRIHSHYARQRCPSPLVLWHAPGALTTLLGKAPQRGPVALRASPSRLRRRGP